jgi:hypothetical protein
MPRYYFDIREGEHIAPDDEGLELPSIERVQEEATRSPADVARDAVRKNHDGRDTRWQSKSVTTMAATGEVYVRVDRHKQKPVRSRGR